MTGSSFLRPDPSLVDHNLTTVHDRLSNILAARPSSLENVYLSLMETIQFICSTAFYLKYKLLDYETLFLLLLIL
jgi:hypothetical protein